jgi:serine/alanine adding enzyme
MPILASPLRADGAVAWGEFVDRQNTSSVYHHLGWRDVICSGYGHQAYYLVGKRHCDGEAVGMEGGSGADGERMGGAVDRAFVGILPLVHLRHWAFGSHLVSLPFFDSGGICADDAIAERALLEASTAIADKVKATSLELRQEHPLRSLDQSPNGAQRREAQRIKLSSGDWYVNTATRKVRMLLTLPADPDQLMGSFKAKLRSQIRKPMKEGLTTKIGGVELLKDFYDVFATNMRDLGSPVHSRKLIEKVLIGFPGDSRLILVYGNGMPMAGAMVIGFKDRVANPWASALRRYSKLAPNMLLYWTMLEWACSQGYSFFDFGRSSPGESTYKFKEQWEAVPSQLYWYRLSRKQDRSGGVGADKEKMRKLIESWKKLPVPLTILLGPRIRRHIPL